MSGQDPFDQPAGSSSNQSPDEQPIVAQVVENPYAQPHGNQTGPPRRSNTLWIVLAVCLAGLIPVMGVCAGLLLPAVQQARQAARRMSCSNNMKVIGIALHNYHSAYQTLPPAYTTDANGNRLHSWRTLILPFIEQQALHQQIDLSKPWDDPVNLPISQTVVPTYACPSTTGDPTTTTYFAVVDPSGIMSGSQATPFRKVLDGLSNTIMIVEGESGLAVPWMQPQYIDLDQFLNAGTAKNFGGHEGGGHVIMGDGAVVFIADSMNPELREAMISKDGREVIDHGSVGY